jgi:hypothetical protein
MWSLTPYLWGPNMTLSLEVNDQDVAGRDVDMPDVIDALEFAFAAHLEGQRGRNGLFADVYFVDFKGDDKSFDLAGSFPGEVVVQGELAATIFETGGLYNPSGTGKGLSPLYGARMFDIDLGVDAAYDFDAGSAEGRNYDVNKALWDALIGVRYVGELSDRWLYDFKVDASAAGTDLAWTALAGVGWAYGAERQHAIVVGYRYMRIDFKETTDRGIDVEPEVELGGFYAAFKFGFRVPRSQEATGGLQL